jgi:uncharacterized protein (DUF302 family)
MLPVDRLADPRTGRQYGMYLPPRLAASRPAAQNSGKSQQSGVTMYYIVDSDKSVNDAARDLEAAVKRHGFGVLHVYDLRQTLKNKGFELPAECRIFDVCNPQQATTVLAADMNLNMALPCRISVYEHAGRTRIGTIRPTRLLGLLSQSAELGAVAQTVESAIEQMIDEAGDSGSD